MLPKNFPNYLQLGRTILELYVRQPNKVCSTLFGCCCPSLVGMPPRKSKAQKGIFSYDVEGDFYPEEFVPRLAPDFTREDET
jgi:hypothetical protein